MNILTSFHILTIFLIFANFKVSVSTVWKFLASIKIFALSPTLQVISIEVSPICLKSSSWVEGLLITVCLKSTPHMNRQFIVSVKTSSWIERLLISVCLKSSSRVDRQLISMVVITINMSVATRHTFPAVSSGVIFTINIFLVTHCYFHMFVKNILVDSCKITKLTSYLYDIMVSCNVVVQFNVCQAFQTTKLTFLFCFIPSYPGTSMLMFV